MQRPRACACWAWGGWCVVLHSFLRNDMRCMYPLWLGGQRCEVLAKCQRNTNSQTEGECRMTMHDVCAGAGPYKRMHVQFREVMSFSRHMWPLFYCRRTLSPVAKSLLWPYHARTFVFRHKHTHTHTHVRTVTHVHTLITRTALAQVHWTRTVHHKFFLQCK